MVEKTGGYTLSYRRQWKHPVFRNLLEAGIWSWMRDTAVWEEKGRSIRFNDTLFHLQRRQLITSISFIAQGFCYGHKATRTLLKTLENEYMINTQATRKGTIITICNYNEYQSIESTEGTLGDNQGSQASQTDGNNNNEDNSYNTSNETDNTPQIKTRNVPIPYKKLQAIWNEVCGNEGLPKLRKLTPTIKQKFKARWHDSLDQSADVWQVFCEEVIKIPWNRGDNPSGWKAKVTWALRSDKINDVLADSEAAKFVKEVVAASPDDDVISADSICTDKVLNEQWYRVQERMRFRHGQATFNSWFKPLRLISDNNNLILLAVPTRFMREWLISHYQKDILDFWQEEEADIEGIEIRVRERKQPNQHQLRSVT